MAVRLASVETHRALFSGFDTLDSELPRSEELLFTEQTDLETVLVDLIAGKDVNDVLYEAMSSIPVNRLLGLVEAIASGIPKKPLHYGIPGYTRQWYEWRPEFSDWVAIEPDELPDCVVLDTETTKRSQWEPVIAIALGLKEDKLTWYYWYTGTSTEDTLTRTQLIRYRSDCLIVGHNINYDASFLSPFYDLDNSESYGFCTQSLAKLLYGLARQQESAIFGARQGVSWPKWAEIGLSSTQKEFNLASLAKKFLGISLDKTIRDGCEDSFEDTDSDRDDLFATEPDQPVSLPGIVQASDRDWIDNVEAYSHYCCSDVETTALLLVCLIKKAHIYGFKPSRYAGMLLDSQQLLCVDHDWPVWLENVNAQVSATLLDMTETVVKAAKAYAKNKPDYDDGLDWTLLKSGVNKGKPKWLVKLLTKTPLRSPLVAVLFGLHYQGHRIVTRQKPNSTRKMAVLAYEVDGRIEYLLNPKTLKPTTSFLGTSSEPRWESGAYTVEKPEHREALNALQGCANWVAIRKNLVAQHVTTIGNQRYIKPRGQLCGTVSGRTSDVWVVLPKPKTNRIGTETFSKVVAPEGYVRLYADVDQEEAVIAALIADAYLGRGVCACPFSLAILTGDKAQKTDIHSVVAETILMVANPALGFKKARNHSKTLNYAANYMAGVNGLRLPLISAGFTPEEADTIVDKFIQDFRGTGTKGKYQDGLASEYYNAVWETLEADEDAKTLLFNQPCPPTLRKSNLNGDFITTLANWRIQATGVDIKNVLMALFRYFCKQRAIAIHLAITEHDSMTYWVREEQAREAAVIFQCCHAIMKSLLWQRLGLYHLPEAQLWFESVDITKRRVATPGYPVTTPSSTLTDGTDLLLSVTGKYSLDRSLCKPA